MSQDVSVVQTVRLCFPNRWRTFSCLLSHSPVSPIHMRQTRNEESVTAMWLGSGQAGIAV